MEFEFTKPGERGGRVEEKEGESSTPADDVFEIERERSASVCSRQSDASVKRKRKIKNSESESMDVNDMASMRLIGVKLRKYLFVESSKVSKSASEYILNCVGEYEEQMMSLISKNERLQGRIDEYERRLDSDVIQGGVNSYACVAGRVRDKSVSAAGMSPDMNTGKDTKVRSFAVVIRPKNTDVKMTSEQVKEKVMRDVSKVLNVRVRAVRKTRSDGIAIETASESELKKVVECGKFNEIGMKVEMPRKIGPKLIVYDVPNEMTNDEFLNEMYVKNLKDRVTECEFKERVKIINRNSRRGAERNCT